METSAKPIVHDCATAGHVWQKHISFYRCSKCDEEYGRRQCRWCDYGFPTFDHQEYGEPWHDLTPAKISLHEVCGYADRILSQRPEVAA